MKKTALALMALSLVLLLSACASQEQLTTYDGAIAQLNELHGRYNVDILETPANREAIASMQADLKSLERKIEENEQTAPVLLLIDFRHKLLESDDLLLDGFKWGEASTTEPGFGCMKGSERILNSSSLRNASAAAGYDAASLLDRFIADHPEKAEQVGVTKKDVLELNANSKILEEQAQRDRTIVMNFCFKNQTQ